MSESPCIPANPDVAGIGVRTSIYAQAFLILIPALLFSLDGKLTIAEQKSLERLSANFLLISCALLFAAIIQAATLGINPYHALIVLNLSWINNLATIAGFGFMAWEGPSRGFWRYRSTQLAILHLCVLGAFGLWTWIKLLLQFNGQSPSPSDCKPTQSSVIFGYNVPIQGPLLVISLVVFGGTALPMFNFLWLMLLLEFFIKILYPLKFIPRWIPTWPQWNKAQYLYRILITIGFVIRFLVDTEIMIRRNAPRIQQGESDWSFGQTLAILLIIVPLLEVAEQGKIWYYGDRTRWKDIVSRCWGRVKNKWEKGMDLVSRFWKKVQDICLGFWETTVREIRPRYPGWTWPRPPTGTVQVSGGDTQELLEREQNTANVGISAMQP
jgi:hypothetical protein